MVHRRTVRKRTVALWAIFILVVLGVTAQLLFTNKVKYALAKNVPPHLNLEYGSLSTNILLGSITLEDISLDHNAQLFNLQARQIKVSGLGYWALLTKGDISVSDFSLNEPVMVLQKTKTDSTKTPSNGSKKSDSTRIAIGNFSINNGQLEVVENPSDSTQLSIQDINFSVSDIHFDPETAQNKIPFTYGNYELHTQKLYYDMGPYEFLQLDALQFTPEESHITNFVLQSKYSRDELSKKLRVEHDHYDLAINAMSLKQFQFGFETEEPQLHIQEITLQEPHFQVYRDKLLPDDTSHKKLYNQALRDLPLDLQVDTIAIQKGTLSYEERLELDVDPNSLRFTELTATINNLHSKKEGKVQVNAEAQLMGDGFLSLDWSFDPQSKSNDFLASGTLSDFKTESINPFLKTNLRAEVSGDVNQMYFTISGNEVKSTGEMKMNYDEFEFVVLKKDRLGVNKLLTAVVNIFARKNSDTDPEGYRYGYFDVERNTDKSFFNYLWINLKAGLLDTVTGKGKKKTD
ncbi:DUF748 domain-containing protein [Flagellimonas iocasae]|uniref:DUF748 domain-containing protein n=1 Tax=Flagellimonas iocasae TaxID=2055905 RepID=A0ABW4XYD1_9FLAO